MEERVYGPPGTGKTTWIADQATKEIEKYGPDLVSICSLTKAAIHEAKDRGIPIDEENLTTLHARCKRSIGAPAPAELYMSDFAKEYPLYAMGNGLPKYMREDRAEAIIRSGATAYDMVQYNRQRMIPIKDWRPDLVKWHEVWKQWCMESGHMDYSMWLEECLTNTKLPHQKVVFVDEAQDHTPLQLAVIRAWPTERLVLVGDDDQSLYEWSGSIPDAFLDPSIQVEKEMVLSRSYRVPRVIHRLAMEIISRVTYRKEKLYNPRDIEGIVDRSSFQISESRMWPMEEIEDGREHMIISPCAYQLEGIISQLKIQGIPFHNPYRRSNATWNPLYTDIAIAARSYLTDRWIGASIARWAQIMKSEVFTNSASLFTMCAQREKEEISYDELRPFLAERYAEALLSRKPEALIKLKRNVQGSWEYYEKVFKGHLVIPKITIGTIHSVKGGECEVVHVFPDLSRSGYEELHNDPDKLHRLFYTAVTRAKDSIVIHKPGNSGYKYIIERGKYV